jgi:hypothetical protein
MSSSLLAPNNRPKKELDFDAPPPKLVMTCLMALLTGADLACWKIGIPKLSAAETRL